MGKSEEMMNIIEREIIIVNGHSDKFSLQYLQDKYPNYTFLTKNGGDWRRKESPLQRKYKVLTFTRQGFGNRIMDMQLDGFIEEHNIFNKSIPADCLSIKNAPSVILQVHSFNEVDHKNGRYDIEQYTIKDFQCLSKAENDAKRQHCKVCKNTGKRFDARCLGSTIGWIFGDENSQFCEGCYWYDPFAFWQKATSKDNI